jgi:hypothetical protein
MVTDIHPALIGPHALARIEARRTALIAYGIEPHDIEVYNTTRSLMVAHEFDTESI